MEDLEKISPLRISSTERSQKSQRGLRLCVRLSLGSERSVAWSKRLPCLPGS